jgi:hypothetical protein
LYKFKSKNYYYGDDEEMGALLAPNDRPRPVDQSNCCSKYKRKHQFQTNKKEANVVDGEDRIVAIPLVMRLLADSARVDAAMPHVAQLLADAKARTTAATNRDKLPTDAKARAEAICRKKSKINVNAERFSINFNGNSEVIRKDKLTADAKQKTDAEAAEK